MKNITVTVSDELYSAARVKAAQRHTTVSALVRAHLEELTGTDSAFERLSRQQEAMLARIHGEHVPSAKPGRP